MYVQALVPTLVLRVSMHAMVIHWDEECVGFDVCTQCRLMLVLMLHVLVYLLSVNLLWL